MKQHYCIVNDTVKENLIAYIRALPVNPRAPMVVEAREETRTSKSSKRYMVDVIEAIYWFGTDRGVKFSEASSKRIAWAQEWRASRG